MPKFSDVFNLRKTQPELDFADVSLNTDNRLFVDPFALSQKEDRWSQDAHHTVVSFFQAVIDGIREGNEVRAIELLGHLREPNETRLGYSRRRVQGAGIGDMQAEDLFDASRILLEERSFDALRSLPSTRLRAGRMTMLIG